MNNLVVYVVVNILKLIYDIHYRIILIRVARDCICLAKGAFTQSILCNVIRARHGHSVNKRPFYAASSSCERYLNDKAGRLWYPFLPIPFLPSLLVQP